MQKLEAELNAENMATGAGENVSVRMKAVDWTNVRYLEYGYKWTINGRTELSAVKTFREQHSRYRTPVSTVVSTASEPLFRLPELLAGLSNRADHITLLLLDEFWATGRCHQRSKSVKKFLTENA